MKLCITKGREMVLLECTSRMEEYMRTTHLEEELPHRCIMLLDSYNILIKRKTTEKQLFIRPYIYIPCWLPPL